MSPRSRQAASSVAAWVLLLGTALASGAAERRGTRPALGGPPPARHVPAQDPDTASAAWRAAEAWVAESALRPDGGASPDLAPRLVSFLDGPEPADPWDRESRDLLRCWAGRDSGPVEPARPGPTTRAEPAWCGLRDELAARHLAPGERRAAALVRLVDGRAPDDPAGDAWLGMAFEAFLEEEGAFRADSALALARAMHRRAHGVWSAFCLEGVARRAGRAWEALTVLDAQLSGVSDPAARLDLLGRRALARAAAGDEPGARADLGRMLVLGGADAYQMLGRRALDTGDRASARSLFRVLVERGRPLDPAGTAVLPAGPEGPEPSPWALRGWGLALLPEPVGPR